MILSHKYRFIFLKTNKTAGTSVEIALSQVCGADDIITPIEPRDEQLRAELGGRGPQNHVAPLSDHGPRDLARLLIKGRRKIRYYHHMPARELRRYVDASVWDDYFKFCFERNPWDRVVSLYYWYHPTEPRPTISKFIDSNGIGILKERGHDLYTIDGEVAVDRICRFERLEDDLDEVRELLGITEAMELPRAKGGIRKKKSSYREMLGEDDRRKVAQLFRKEIELCDYSF